MGWGDEVNARMRGLVFFDQLAKLIDCVSLSNSSTRYFIVLTIVAAKIAAREKDGKCAFVAGYARLFPLKIFNDFGNSYCVKLVAKSCLCCSCNLAISWTGCADLILVLLCNVFHIINIITTENKRQQKAA